MRAFILEHNRRREEGTRLMMMMIDQTNKTLISVFLRCFFLTEIPTGGG